MLNKLPRRYKELSRRKRRQIPSLPLTQTRNRRVRKKEKTHLPLLLRKGMKSSSPPRRRERRIRSARRRMLVLLQQILASR